MTPFRNFVRSSFLGRLLLIPYRLQYALRVTLKPVWQALKWTITSREHYNYTYDLDPTNLKYLSAYISVVTGQNREAAERYLNEIAEDEQLKAHIVRLTAASKERHVADREIRFGRRMGWYALVRATKPRVVVETGVDKGLGSVVIAAALMRNAQEGFPGKLIAIDINPRAGYLLQAPYAKFGEMAYGDSLATLAALKEEVDFFIHDSDHTPEFEGNEYSAVQPKLSRSAIVLSDNAAHTDKLFEFALKTGRQFLFFAERPKNHWWPGEGIAVAFTPGKAQP